MVNVEHARDTTPKTPFPVGTSFGVVFLQQTRARESHPSSVAQFLFARLTPRRTPSD